jgi:hypothetical protein
MTFVEDLSPFFADFGVDATVGGVAVVGIFDKAAAQAFGLVAGNDPQLIVRDTVVAAEGAAVVIGAASYVVAGAQDDGSGLRTLALEKQ